MADGVFVASHLAVLRLLPLFDSREYTAHVQDERTVGARMNQRADVILLLTFMEINCVGYLLWIRLTKIGYFQEKTTSAFFSPCGLGALRDLEDADEVSLPADSDPQIRQRIKNGRSVRRIVIIHTLDACTRIAVTDWLEQAYVGPSSQALHNLRRIGLRASDQLGDFRDSFSQPDGGTVGCRTARASGERLAFVSRRTV
jgi:hypothetical protein